MTKPLLTISQASKFLGISEDTLRRWDKTENFKPTKKNKKTGYRYYSKEDLLKYLSSLDICKLALKWVKSEQENEPQRLFYCENIGIFNYRLGKLEKELMSVPEFTKSYSLTTSMVGEIGNNSFDHNIGNWPDVPGVFFGYNIKARRVVLADRGQGILKTLSRVIKLKDDAEALKVAFTEILSGRAPEPRGNGLKYVKQIITDNKYYALEFQTGDAKLTLKYQDIDLKIIKTSFEIKGCLALITF